MNNVLKTKTLVVLVGLLLIGFFAWFYTSKTLAPQSAGALHVGAILPLTGNGADQGEWIQQGLELAADDINAAAARKVEFSFQDNPDGAPQSAVSAYQNLETTSRIPLVFTWGSGTGNALTPLVNKDRVIQVGVATAADSYSSPNDYTFRNFPRATDEGAFLAEAVYRQMQIKSIAVANIQNDYGESSVAAFTHAYQAGGGTIIATENFNPGTTDFRTIIAKLKAAHPAYLYLATYPVEGAIFLRQAAELGFHPQVIASAAFVGSSELFKLAGNALEKLIVVSPLAVLPNDSAYKNFAEKYQAKFGHALASQNIYSILAYNALKAVVSDIASCAVEDSACMKQLLYAAKAYQGVGQKIAFDVNGDVQFNFHFLTVKNGMFVPYTPTTP